MAELPEFTDNFLGLGSSLGRGQQPGDGHSVLRDRVRPACRDIIEQTRQVGLGFVRTDNIHMIRLVADQSDRNGKTMLDGPGRHRLWAGWFHRGQFAAHLFRDHSRVMVDVVDVGHVAGKAQTG
jgi:hypothetical protein